MSDTATQTVGVLGGIGLTFAFIFSLLLYILVLISPFLLYHYLTRRMDKES